MAVGLWSNWGPVRHEGALGADGEWGQTVVKSGQAAVKRTTTVRLVRTARLLMAASLKAVGERRAGTSRSNLKTVPK